MQRICTAFINLVMVFLIAGAIIGISLIIEGCIKYGQKKIAETNQEQYSAWQKLTGNEKNLTLEEFVTLKNGGLIKSK